MTPAVMVQGTGSNVGKSVLVAGLCRAFTRRGLAVRPFKPQNMSNNAAVTVDGGEIGRAQALQARAAKVGPVVDMNPVLLKPETERGAQVVLQGKRLTHATARDYTSLKPDLLKGVLESFHRLESEADLVLVEGAGSPAEVNLRSGDIANMGFAAAAEVPVILAGDIDRGGVIAQLVGTKAVISPKDAEHIKGFLINKFRGDVSLFDNGYALIAEKTGWHGLGVLPWFSAAGRLPAEDALDIGGASGSGNVKIAVPILSRIANFDDLDPLKLEPDVTVEMVQAGEPLPGDADLVLIPGTKSTRGDLAYFRQQGWDVDLEAHRRRGGRVLGVCGGYQMLGRSISDPEGIEGWPGTSKGLGLLDVVTEMMPDKRLTMMSAIDTLSGLQMEGYEIHIGRTQGPDCLRPMFRLNDADVGATSADGLVEGAYFHGVFASDAWRRSYLGRLGASSSGRGYWIDVEETLDQLADHLEEHLDLDRILAIARGRTD